MKFYYFLISSILLIGLVLCIRKLFRQKLSPGVIYALWLIPMIRLMLPVGVWEFPIFGTMAEMINRPYEIVTEWLDDEKTLESAQIQESEVQHMQEDAPDNVQKTKIYDAVKPEANSAGSEVQTSDSTGTVETEVSEPMEKWQIALWVWLAGAIVLGTYVIVQNYRLWSGVQKMPVKEQVNGIEVRVDREVLAPCLVGLRKPKIVVPEKVFENTALYDYAVQHELAHAHQKDPLWNLIRIILCVVYWWNPFVWLAAKCAEEDAELACDARVLKDQASEIRKAYGYALLQMIAQEQERCSSLMVSTSMSGNKKSMKRRIEGISHRTSTKRYVAFPVVLLLIGVLVLGCAVPSNKSWLEVGKWTYEEDTESCYYQTEYKYSLQKNIRSLLVYYEIYRYDGVSERKILAYGEIEEFAGAVKFAHKISKISEERKLVLETNGVGIEMNNPMYRYSAGGAKSFGSLQSDAPIELVPEKSLILGMEYRGLSSVALDSLSAVYSPENEDYEEIGIQTWDCNVLSDYSEEELLELFNENWGAGVVAIGLYRVVFSELPGEKLCAQYEQREVNGVVGDLAGEYTDFAAFTKSWAEAFVSRDAEKITGMVNEEAYKQLKEAGLMGEEEGYRYFGWSSPWPMFENEQYEILQCNDLGAEILYYAIISTPHVYVWKETLQFEQSEDGLLVKSEELTMYDEIQSLEEYLEVYPEEIISETMMDYAANGLGEVLNQNALEQPNDEVYHLLFDPVTAAYELLNISKDENVTVYSVEDSKGTANVQIHFLKEGNVTDTIEITMWQPYGEDGIWIPK